MFPKLKELSIVSPKFAKFIMVFLFYPALLWGNQVADITVDFEYTPPLEKELAGFRLYQDAELVCMSTDPFLRSMECQVAVPLEDAHFTITAFFSDGVETLHSDPYVVDYLPKSQVTPMVHLQIFQEEPDRAVESSTEISIPFYDYGDKQKADVVFNWLEKVLPEIFPTRGRLRHEHENRYYRIYPASGAVIQMGNGCLYYGQHNLGLMDEWLERIPKHITFLSYDTHPLADQVGSHAAPAIEQHLVQGSILYKNAMTAAGEILNIDPAGISFFQWQRMIQKAFYLLGLSERESDQLYNTSVSVLPDLGKLAEHMTIDVRQANSALRKIRTMVDHHVWENPAQTAHILALAGNTLRNAHKVSLVSGETVMTGGYPLLTPDAGISGAMAVQGVDLLIEIKDGYSRMAFGDEEKRIVLDENSRNIPGPADAFITVLDIFDEKYDGENIMAAGRDLTDVLFGNDTKSMVPKADGYHCLMISNPLMVMYAGRYDNLDRALRNQLNVQETGLLEMLIDLAEKDEGKKY